MDAAVVDQVRLNFNAQGLIIINIAIGLMMLGVALELKVSDFKRIIISPRAPAAGLIAQFILLPAFTYVLTLIIRPIPSIALGMILVASCPGGNLSNIITYLARGNTAVSISMTAVSSAAAIVMTPLNLSIWGRFNPDTAAILRTVYLDPINIFITIFCILGIPMIIGMTASHYLPGIAVKVRRPFKIFSLLFFMFIVAGALALNWAFFVQFVGVVLFAVILHNALALNLGYWSGRLVRLTERDTRAVCIEVGIQNSALGLVLVFSFFDGLGGMAVLVAMWGIWHIIAGLITAFFFSRKRLPEGEKSA